MQRAPVFVFDSAREARDFRDWVDEHMGRDSRRGRGDLQRRQAALHRHVPGQQVRVPALQLLDRRRGGPEHGGPGDVRRLQLDPRADVDTVRKFYLESNFATDKKASQINIMRTRGKRVTAEAIVPRAGARRGDARRAGEPGVPLERRDRRRVLLGRQQQRRALAQRHHRDVHRHRAGRGQRGGVVGRHPLQRDHPRTATSTSRSRSPRSSSPRTAAAPSLATQRECLELLGCTGRGKVKKLAEIIAGVALAGRTVARLGHLVARLGVEPREVRAQPLTPRAYPAVRASRRRGRGPLERFAERNVPALTPT